MYARSLAPFAAAALVAALVPVPAFAGPPLLCHPFDIAGAESLPWGEGGGWRSPDPRYDMGRLTPDTLALLSPSTPTLARMETLRRAAIYASADPGAARKLLARLRDRARASEASGRMVHLPWFDAGYFAATLQQIHDLEPEVADVARGVDAYGLVEKSLRLSGGDPTIEFAAALMATGESGRRADYARHAKRAREGAGHDPLLALNISRVQ